MPRRYRRKRPEPARYEKFDGRTFLEQVDALTVEILRERTPVIHESFRLDSNGLHMVVDAEYLDQTVMGQALDRFFMLGEADWTAPEPVLPERLRAKHLADMKAM